MPGDLHDCKQHVGIVFVVPPRWRCVLNMLQPPPSQLVHRAFGEFVVGAASIQPLPDTCDFVLESCAFLAEFCPEEGVREQQSNKRLERYLGKHI